MMIRKKSFLVVSIIFVLSLISLLSLMSSCRPQPFTIDDSIIKDSFDLSVYEPSGLSYSFNKESLFVVSDRGGVYEISKTGDLLGLVNNIEGDLEGVTTVSESENMFVVNETKGNVIKIDKNNMLIDEYSILENGSNSGLEGISYDRKRDILFMLKEKSEGSLIRYSCKDQKISFIQLGFANDYSGIYYHERSDKLWIVSDESKTLNQCSLTGRMIKSYALPISSMEGLVVNNDETEAYIVSDKNKKLYIIDLTK